MADAAGRRTGAALTLAIALLAGALLGLLAEFLWPSRYAARMLLAPGAGAAQASRSANGDGGTEAERLERVGQLTSPGFLRAVVQRGLLTVRAEPVRLPLLGPAIARRRSGAEPAPPLLNLARYAWGGERLRITRFEVDESSYRGAFVLQVTGDAAYALLDADGRTLCAARVGAANCRADDVELAVGMLQARPGTRFRLRRVPPEDAVAALARRLEVTALGATGGLLAVELRDDDPGWLGAAATAMADEFLRQSQPPEAQLRLTARLKSAGREFNAAQQVLEQAGAGDDAIAVLDPDTRDRIAAIAALEARRAVALLSDSAGAGAAQAVKSDGAPDPPGDVAAALERRIAAERRALLTGRSDGAALERELRFQVASETYLALLERRAAAQADAPAPAGRVLEPPRIAPAVVPGQRRGRFAGLGALVTLLAAGAVLTRRARERAALGTPSRLSGWTGLPVVAVIDDLGATGSSASQAASADTTQAGAAHDEPPVAAYAAAADMPHAADIGLRSLATALAINAAGAASTVFGFTALRAPVATLVERLAQVARPAGGVPIATRSISATEELAAEAPAAASRGHDDAITLLELPAMADYVPGAHAAVPDPVLVCVSAHRDRRGALERALEQLRQREVKLAGIVLLRDGPVPESRGSIRRKA